MGQHLPNKRFAKRVYKYIYRISSAFPFLDRSLCLLRYVTSYFWDMLTWYNTFCNYVRKKDDCCQMREMTSSCS